MVAAVALAWPACSSGNSSRSDVARPTPEAGGEPVVEPASRDRPRLEREQPLPRLARTLVRKHMRDHGSTMETLLWSALMLAHDDTVTAADWILAAPRLSRPSPGAGDTLNDALPAQFFALQDDMYQSTRALKDAAERRDDQAIATSYASLVETCVTCHALYLRLPGEPVP